MGSSLAHASPFHTFSGKSGQSSLCSPADDQTENRIIILIKIITALIEIIKPSTYLCNWHSDHAPWLSEDNSKWPLKRSGRKSWTYSANIILMTQSNFCRWFRSQDFKPRSLEWWNMRVWGLAWVQVSTVLKHLMTVARLFQCCTRR